MSAVFGTRQLSKWDRELVDIDKFEEKLVLQRQRESALAEKRKAMKVYKWAWKASVHMHSQGVFSTSEVAAALTEQYNNLSSESASFYKDLGDRATDEWRKGRQALPKVKRQRVASRSVGGCLNGCLWHGGGCPTVDEELGGCSVVEAATSARSIAQQQALLQRNIANGIADRSRIKAGSSIGDLLTGWQLVGSGNLFDTAGDAEVQPRDIPTLEWKRDAESVLCHVIGSIDHGSISSEAGSWASRHLHVKHDECKAFGKVSYRNSLCWEAGQCVEPGSAGHWMDRFRLQFRVVYRNLQSTMTPKVVKQLMDTAMLVVSFEYQTIRLQEYTDGIATPVAVPVDSKRFFHLASYSGSPMYFYGC